MSTAVCVAWAVLILLRTVFGLEGVDGYFLIRATVGGGFDVL